MRSERWVLDLFCGAGGCSEGYHRAGFYVHGVDHVRQRNYPFAYWEQDALDFLRNLPSNHKFDVIHASPPCQAHSAMNRAVKAGHPDLIGPTRELLLKLGKPYVIENVEGAPLARGSITLCGTLFGLRVRRHRVFEINPPLPILLPDCQCRNGVVTGRLVGHRVSGKVTPGRTKPPHRTESDRREALDCMWMTTREARQAVPPAYTEFIGRQLLNALG